MNILAKEKWKRFSDPWPKDRHAKRRLPSKEYLRRFAQILTKDGTIEFKTDNRALFDFAVDEVEAGGFKILQITYDLHSDPVMNEGNIMTEYEERFSAKGNPIVWAAEETDEEVDYYAEAEERKSEEIQSNSIQGWPQGPAIGAEGAILMEADSGTVLYAKNIHEHLYPASITKLLTGLLAYEKLSMDDMVEFSETAVFSIEFGSSSIGIDPGEALTVEQSLYALMVASANEVAAGLAEKMGGSLDKFPDMMNSRAESLGCTDSHFTNPHGLFNEEHYTSAYDMALIAREYFSHEELAKIANSPTYFMESSDRQPEEFTLFNKHKLINGEIEYEGILGETYLRDPQGGVSGSV